MTVQFLAHNLGNPSLAWSGDKAKNYFTGKKTD